MDDAELKFHTEKIDQLLADIRSRVDVRNIRIASEVEASVPAYAAALDSLKRLASWDSPEAPEVYRTVARNLEESALQLQGIYELHEKIGLSRKQALEAATEYAAAVAVLAKKYDPMAAKIVLSSGLLLVSLSSTVFAAPILAAVGATVAVGTWLTDLPSSHKAMEVAVERLAERRDEVEERLLFSHVLKYLEQMKSSLGSDETGLPGSSLQYKDAFEVITRTVEKKMAE